MRFLSADWVFPLHVAPIKGGVLKMSKEGKILDVFTSRDTISVDKLEIFSGVLCPGFINTHCHLELSHLLGFAEEKKGLLDFIKVIKKRNKFTKDQIKLSIDTAEQQMIKNGIVAVGDICNTNDTIDQKQKRNLHYYNFIEVFTIHEDKINDEIKKSTYLRDQFRRIDCRSTIVPHSLYAVPPDLMIKILDAIDHKDNIICIHNQETKEENQLFQSKNGRLFKWLNKMRATSSIWDQRNSHKLIFRKFSKKIKMLLVHNTFTKKQDLIEAYYSTCPKANLYIEDSLPDYSIFDVNKLCVGTDSLASNNSLSILEELFVIQESSNFDLNTLLKIGCHNGAKALGFDFLGTFEKNKTPGVNLI